MSNSFQESMVPCAPEMAVRGRRKGHGGARKGAGRPALFVDKARMVVDMERADYDALRALADAKGVSAPELVRSLLRRHLKTRRRR